MEGLRDTRTLLIHHGELADVRRLLLQLGTQVVERRGRPVEADHAHRWHLVVAAPEFALQLNVHLRVSSALCVAVLEQESRSLRTLLRESGIDYIVRRPVHPAALRGLLAHCLWQRPTRRRHERVIVGAPIRIKRRFAKRRAILADLSLRGARVLAPFDPKPGTALRLLLPGDLTHGAALALNGTVVTAFPQPGDPGNHSVALSFSGLGPDERRGVRALIAAHQAGPVQLSQAQAQSLALPDPPRRRAAPVDADHRHERRSGERIPVERPLARLSEEAERILVTRDLSLGGTSVQPSPGLELNTLIRVELLDREGESPLALDARVVRDHGEEGVALRFEGVDPQARKRLAQFLEAAAVEDCLGDTPSPAAVLERVA